MKRTLVLIGVIMVLGGCAISSKTYTPDGREGFSIDCSGSALSWGKCLEKAGDLCGARGYEVLERSGDTGSVVGGGQYSLYGGSVITRTMLIACR